MQLDPPVVMTTSNTKMTSADDKPSLNVDEAHSHPRHKEHNVVPIQQEAVEDAYHIKLGWRSWVSENPNSVLDKSLTK